MITIDDKWLYIVLHYGERFPDKKVADLDLDFKAYVKNIKICELKNDLDHWLVKFDDDVCVFSSFDNTFKYNSVNGIIPVPEHIKLRLLVEGKEDLV